MPFLPHRWMSAAKCPAAALAVLWAALAAGCADQVTPEAQQQFDAGVAAYRRGDLDATQRHMGSFVEQAGRSGLADEAWYNRGRARLDQGDAGGAADLRQAIKLTSDAPLRASALVLLADLAQRGGDAGEAQRLYRDALAAVEPSQKPADAAMLKLACLLQRAGRWSEADLLLDKVIFLYAGSGEAEAAESKVRSRAWTVCAGAYGQKRSADAAAAQLAGKGLPAVVRQRLAGGRLLHVVEVGAYATRAQAEAALPAVQAHSAQAVVMESRL